MYISHSVAGLSLVVSVYTVGVWGHTYLVIGYVETDHSLLNLR